MKKTSGCSCSIDSHYTFSFLRINKKHTFRELKSSLKVLKAVPVGSCIVSFTVYHIIKEKELIGLHVGVMVVSTVVSQQESFQVPDWGLFVWSLHVLPMYVWVPVQKHAC